MHESKKERGHHTYHHPSTEKGVIVGDSAHISLPSTNNVGENGGAKREKECGVETADSCMRESARVKELTSTSGVHTRTHTQFRGIMYLF